MLNLFLTELPPPPSEDSSDDSVWLTIMTNSLLQGVPGQIVTDMFLAKIKVSNLFFSALEREGYNNWVSEPNNRTFKGKLRALTPS